MTESGRHPYLESLEQWKGGGGFGLENMRTLCAALGDPQDKVKTIHVAGTNGKGSVCAAICSILGKGGYKVGLTTSPHLSKINERVVIDGTLISDEELEYYSAKVMRASSATGVVPTFFEAITLVAFLAFVRSEVDYAVCEVGLGGRLDATNVILKPEVAVITTIGLDHEELLGSTLAAIASEKAGIIKIGSRVVVGDLYPEARYAVSNTARSHDVLCHEFGREFGISVCGEGGYLFESCIGESFSFLPMLDGEHQARNMAIAAHVAMLLGLSAEQCKIGIESVRWPGRMEVVKRGSRVVVIDAAHNLEAFEALSRYLHSRFPKGIEIGFGVLECKRWMEMVKVIQPHVRRWNYLLPESSRALSSDSFARWVSSIGINAFIYDCDYDRFIRERIFESDESCDIPLLLTGSIYLIGGLRSKIVSGPSKLWQKAQQK